MSIYCYIRRFMQSLFPLIRPSLAVQYIFQNVIQFFLVFSGEYPSASSIYSCISIWVNIWVTMLSDSVAEVCIFSKECIYFCFIWIEANVSVHPTVNMSRSFKASRVRGHRKDFQIRHCRRSLTFRVKSKNMLLLYFVFVLGLNPGLPFLLFLSSERGKQKTGREDRGILSEGRGKGQVILADRLKYHGLPGACHRLWCFRGICDKSGVILKREQETTAASKKPPRRKIDQVLLTESLTVGKSSYAVKSFFIFKESHFCGNKNV